MGNQNSIIPQPGHINELSENSLSPEMMDLLTKETIFTPQEMQHLLLFYRKLLVGGRIERQDFIKNIHFTSDQIGTLIFNMIDHNRDHNIDFVEFVKGLNAFCPGADLDDKIFKCFNAFDLDGNHEVSCKEIKSIVIMSLENNTLMQLDEAHLDLLIDDLFEMYDSTKSGRLMLGDFSRMVHSAPGMLDVFEFDIGMLPPPDELKKN